MESDIQLAIMEKARRIYGSQSTFLSFPLAPYTYDPAHIDFSAETDELGKQALVLAEFSRVVNIIPRGITHPPEEETYVWDAYDDVMRRAKLAKSIRSADEEDEFNNVSDYLFDEVEDNLRTPSAELSTYQEYRDAEILLKERFGAEQLNAELSDSADVKAQWNTVDKQKWKTQFDALEHEWAEKGFKTQVEHAQRRYDALSALSPLATWSAWASLYDKDMDTRTAGDNSRYVETRYSPINATREGSWVSYTLPVDVAQKLIQEAPVPLRNKLDPNNKGLQNIESIELEYSSARIERPWFAADAFKARFFKYPNIISSGDDTAEGRCPSYVTAVVFARNIKVKYKKPSAPTITTFSFDFTDKKKAKAVMTQRAVFNKQLVSLQVAGATAKPAKPIAMSMPPLTATTITSPKVVRDHRTRRAFPTSTKRLAMAVRPVTLVKPATAGAPAAKPDSPPDKPPTVEKTDNTIQILAFICKRVPNCPDPDLSLDWGT